MIDIISRGIAATALKEVVELKDFVVSHMVQTDLIKIETVLPDVGEENKIYLVPKEVGEISEKDYYDEYLWVNKGSETEANYQWEFVASRAYNIDLSEYATKDYVNNELSKNDIVRTEFEMNSISDTFEVRGEIINVELIDTVTSETIIGKTTIVDNGDTSSVTVSFSSVPTNPIIVVVFSTQTSSSEEITS